MKLFGGSSFLLSGGRFYYGFMTTGVTQSEGGSTLPASQLFAAAALGGTDSALTGGKFANGARTVAMAHLFNAEGGGTSIMGFIKEEGWGVITRTLQIFGGGGQVLAGAGMCYTTGGLACAGGGLIAAKGIDNIQAGWRGEDTYSQQALTAMTGSETAGALINSGLDLGVSSYGALKSVNKISDLGVKQVYFVNKDPLVYERAYKQASFTANTVEGISATVTITDTTMKVVK